eukprot:gene1465-2816_t
MTVDIESNGIVTDFNREQENKNDSRLFPDHLLYCEGAHRPLFRGVLHFISTLVLPLGLWFLIQESKGSPISITASVFYIFTNLFCYGFSWIFHIGTWSAKTEILLQKLDHCGIALLSTGSITICALVLLPPHLGILLLGGTACSCIWTCHGIFNLQPSVLRQVVTAGICTLFIPAFFDMMTAIEFTSMIAAMLFQCIGVYIFVNRWPDPFHHIFGYHEVFHSFVVAAGFSDICKSKKSWIAIQEGLIISDVNRQLTSSKKVFRWHTTALTSLLRQVYDLASVLPFVKHKYHWRLQNYQKELYTMYISIIFRAIFRARELFDVVLKRI